MISPIVIIKIYIYFYFLIILTKKLIISFITNLKKIKYIVQYDKIKKKGDNMINTKKKTFITIGIFALLAIVAIGFCGCQEKAQKSAYSKDDFQQTDACVIEIKDFGTVEVGLDANQAPATVANFKKLVNQGFYNGLTFHRIIKDFMAQGGDPKGDGTGGSPDKIKGEFQSNGVKNTLAHVRGAISMARSNDNNSASSQFFIVHKTSSNNSQSLDGKYCCFGYVTSGMEVIDKIIEQAKPTDENETIPKEKQPIITSIKMK